MAKEKNKTSKKEKARKKRKWWPWLTIPILFLLVVAVAYYFFAPPSWPYSAKALREQRVQQAKQQEQLLAQENAELRAALSAMEDEKRQLESQLEQLNRQLAEQQAKLEEKVRAEQEEAYQRLRNTAKLFSDMSPSKAVTILKAMPLHETALLLKTMNDKERSRLLSRFDPDTAATLTLALQQVPPLDETADLEEVREQLMAALPNSPADTTRPAVSAEEMAETLSAMDATSAAEMVTHWWSRDRQGTLDILRAMSPASRAQLFSELEADLATEISRQLVRGAS